MIGMESGAQSRYGSKRALQEAKRIRTLSTLPTEKAKRLLELKQSIAERLKNLPSNQKASLAHFDHDIGVNRMKLVRSKRPTLQFVEQGQYTKQAEIMRLHNGYGAARFENAALRAISKLTERLFNSDARKDPIPAIEWWDCVLVPPQSQRYDELIEGTVVKCREEKVAIYVEHPVPIEPPSEPAPPPPQPMKLTKKERKKLRTQHRLAREKELQELVRQGKLEPPKPKVKLSNLYKVLGAEVVQDPTRLELEIRASAAEREQAHRDRNLARKLTPGERREKETRKRLRRVLRRTNF